MLRGKNLFRVGLLGGLLVMSWGVPSRADDPDGARPASHCAAPLSHIHITAPIKLPSGLAARLQKRFSGKCPSDALAREISRAVARMLGQANINVQGMSHVLDRAQGRVGVQLGGTKNFVIVLRGPTVPRVSFAEIIGSPEEENELRLRFALAGERPHKIEWLRDGVPIDGADGVRLKLSPADIGARISARLHLKAASTSEMVETAKTEKIAAAMTPPLALSPRIAGGARVGAALQALYTHQPGRKALARARARYQWLRNGLPIAGATARSYRLTAKDIGAQISVAITPRDQNGQIGQAVRPALQAMIAPPLSLAQTRPAPRPARDPREQAARDMALIRRLVRDGKLADARQALENFTADFPRLLSGRLMLARVLIQTDRTQQAEDVLKNLVVDKAQSDTGRATAQRLLDKLQAVRAAAKRREKQRRGETSLAIRQRFGQDRNVRRAAEDGEITYYLGNLASLAGLNIDSVIAPTPGAIDESQDSQENELYADTMINLSHGWKNRFGHGENINLSAMVSRRGYDTYDDNNDGEGDGDYQILLLRGGASMPVKRYLMGGHLSVTQLSLGGETASRTTELSGNVMMPFKRDTGETDLLSVSLAHLINNADPLELSAANASRSGHGWRLSSQYRSARFGMDWQANASAGLQSHNNAQLDYKNFNLGLQGAGSRGDWQYGLGAHLTKRINDHVPLATDFNAIWGLKRRHDDTFSLRASLAHPVRFDWGDMVVSLDMNARKTDSNLQRFNMQTGDLGLNLSYQW